MLLELALVELRIAKRAELWSQTAEGSNESELGRDVVGNKAKLHFLSELKSVFSLSLHLLEWVSACQKVGNHVTAAEGRKGQIAGFLCGVKTKPVPGPGVMQMLSPGKDVMTE